MAEAPCRIAAYAEIKQLGGAEVGSIGSHSHASDVANPFVLISMINHVQEEVALKNSQSPEVNACGSHKTSIHLAVLTG